MYLYAEWAGGLKSQGKQLKNQEALLEMRRAGTAALEGGGGGGRVGCVCG